MIYSNTLENALNVFAYYHAKSICKQLSYPFYSGKITRYETWQMQTVISLCPLQTRETCRQTRETLLWNALKTIPRLLEDLKFRKGIVLKSFHSNVYLVLSLPVCKIAVSIYRTQFRPHGGILMLRNSALTIANRLPNDNRQVTNSSPTVDRPSVNSSIW